MTLEPSDSILLANWHAQRDAEAMSRLVARHGRMVYAACRRILGDSPAAQDAAQECFIRLTRINATGQDSLAGLLHTMATRQALNHLRGEQRRRTREKAYQDLQTDAVETAWNDVRPHIDEAIAALPDHLRVPLVRHFLEGETHDAIAQDLGLTRAAITYRVDRAIQLVRAALRRKGIMAGGLLLAEGLTAESAQAMPASLTAEMGRLAISGLRASAKASAAVSPVAWLTKLFRGGTAMKLIAASCVLAIAGLFAIPANKPADHPVKATAPAKIHVAAQKPKPQPPASPQKTKENSTQTTPAPPSESIPASPLTITVTSDTGHPRPETYFSCDWPISVYSDKRADANGIYTLQDNTSPTPTAWMAICQNANKAALFTFPQETGKLNLTLDWNLATLIGRVLTTEGKGVFNAPIQFRIANAAGQAFLSKPFGADGQGYYETEFIPVHDGYTLETRILPPKGEEPTPWTSPMPLTAKTKYIEIPDILIAPETAQNIAANQRIENQHCDMKRWINAPGREHIGGRITDLQGTPVEDAEVIISQIMGDRMSNDIHTATNSQGQWTALVPEGINNLRIEVIHANYIPTPLLHRDQTPSMESLRNQSAVMTIEPGLHVTGTLRDPNGAPIPDAVLVVNPYRCWTPGGPEVTANAPIEDGISTTRTANDGTFDLACIPQNDGQIQIFAPGYAFKKQSITPKDATRPLDITLETGANVKIRVLDPQGNPITNAHVNANEFTSDERVSLTGYTGIGPDGFYTLEHIPTGGTLRIMAGVKREGSLNTRKYLSTSAEITVPQQEPFDLVLYPPPIFKGNVIDDTTGQPITEFTVSNKWKRDYKDVFEGITFSDDRHIKSPKGLFSIELNGIIASYPSKTTFAVGVFAKGYIPALSPGYQLGDPIENWTIRLKPGAPFTGTILDADGQPAANAEVMWIRPGLVAFIENGERYKQTAFQPDDITRSASDGTFTLYPHEGSGCFLVLHKSGYTCDPDGKTQPGDTITLTPWARIEGKIYAGATSAPNTFIALNFPAQDNRKDRPVYWNSSTHSSQDGAFQIDNIPAIPLSIGILPQYGSHGELSHTTSFTPEPGTTKTVEIARGGRTATGQMVLATILPPGATFKPESLHIVATRKSDASENAPTYIPTLMGDGTFRFDNIPEGTYTFMIDLHGPRPKNACGFGDIVASARTEFTIPAGSPDEPVEIPAIHLGQPEK